jgi:hypothetical protein
MGFDEQTGHDSEDADQKYVMWMILAGEGPGQYRGDDDDSPVGRLI